MWNNFHIILIVVVVAVAAAASSHGSIWSITTDAYSKTDWKTDS